MKLGVLQIILILILIYFLLGGNIKTEFIRKMFIENLKKVFNKIRRLFKLK